MNKLFLSREPGFLFKMTYQAVFMRQKNILILFSEIQ